MIRYLLFLLFPLTLFAQSQKISDMTSATSLTGSEYVPIVQTTNKKSTVTLLRGWASTIGTAGQLLKVNSGATALEFFTPSYLSTYPGAGIPLSTGSAWGTSITDNSANWNTAYGWGNHASAGYITLTGTQVFTGNKVIRGGGFSLSLGDYSYELLSFDAISSGASTIRSNSTFGGYITASDDPTGTKIATGPYQFNPQLGNGTDGLAQIITSGYAGRLVIGKSASLNSGNPYVIFDLTPSSDATGDTYYRNSSGYFTRLAAGTNGHVLTLSGGIPSWAATSGWALTGTSTLTGAVDIVGSSSNTIKHTFAGLGVTPTDGAGLHFINTTAAAAGAQQISPSIVLEGNGWKTNATAASQSVKYKIDVLPTQGAANPSGLLWMLGSVNGAAYPATSSTSAIGFDAINGVIYPGAGITFNTSSFGEIQNSRILRISTNNYFDFRGAWGSTTAIDGLWRVSNSVGGNFLNISGTSKLMKLDQGFAPTSGAGGFISEELAGTINMTGTSSGNVIGYNINHTVTAAKGDYTGYSYNPTVTSITGANRSFYATSGNVAIPVSSYINFGTTNGSSGYGLRDNSGTVEVKNSGGAWTPIGDANVKQVKVTVSSAELLASFTTPKTLIAAPGAGSYIQIISCEMFLDYNSAAYVDGGAGGVTVDYVSSLSTLTGIFSISSTSDTMSFLDVAAGQRALTNVENQPVILYSPTSNPTTGNSPLYVYLTYRIVTL